MSSNHIPCDDDMMTSWSQPMDDTSKHVSSNSSGQLMHVQSMFEQPQFDSISQNIQNLVEESMQDCPSMNEYLNNHQPITMSENHAYYVSEIPSQNAQGEVDQSISMPTEDIDVVVSNSATQYYLLDTQDPNVAARLQSATFDSSNLVVQNATDSNQETVKDENYDRTLRQMNLRRLIPSLFENEKEAVEERIGTVKFRCVQCDYSSEDKAKIESHLKIHR